MVEDAEKGLTYSNILKTLKTSIKDADTVNGIKTIRKSVRGNLLLKTDRSVASKVKEQVQLALNTKNIRLINGERMKLIHIKGIDSEDS